jgi:hypothetical protein
VIVSGDIYEQPLPNRRTFPIFSEENPSKGAQGGQLSKLGADNANDGH